MPEYYKAPEPLLIVSTNLYQYILINQYITPLIVVLLMRQNQWSKLPAKVTAYNSYHFIFIKPLIKAVIPVDGRQDQSNTAKFIHRINMIS